MSEINLEIYCLSMCSFGYIYLRTTGPSDDRAFGHPDLRTSGPSDIWTFGHPDLRTCEQSPHVTTH